MNSVSYWIAVALCAVVVAALSWDVACRYLGIPTVTNQVQANPIKCSTTSRPVASEQTNRSTAPPMAPPPGANGAVSDTHQAMEGMIAPYVQAGQHPHLMEPRYEN